MSGATEPILAAGGVLWRDGEDGVEVAVVHRPKYDDWSLPKGKADPGEHLACCAVREIAEETGFTAALGRSLGEVGYLRRIDGVERPKVVHYWAMHAVEGRFEPSAEVDELLWLPPEAAKARLGYERDRALVDTFGRTPAATTSVLLVRHGSAGSRYAWAGEDRLRPLDATGHAQAAAVATVLPCWHPHRILSADVLRCSETVRPLAVGLGLPVEDDPVLGEDHYWDHRDTGLEEVRRLGEAGSTSVVCSQGGVIPDVVGALLLADGLAVAAPVGSRKGSVWVLSFAAGRLAAADYLARLH